MIRRSARGAVAEPYADSHDVVDLTAADPPSGGKIRLECTATSCREKAYTRPVRARGEPKTVVRCADCGKRHSVDSLIFVD